MANLVNTLVVPAVTTLGPYYDDFDEDKGFMRILFRPGRAVQARELTQLQTILQNQIERFGQNIFVNGSSVIGGVSDITPVISINLVSTFANTSIKASDFQNQTIRYASANTDVIARVLQTTEANDSEPPTLYVKYLSGTSFGPGDSIKIDNANVFANIISTANATSNALMAFIYDSVYFFNGFFIKVPTQSTIVSKYDIPSANARIGLELDDSIITETNDSSLLDPALEASNYQAPGATRYKAALVLSTRTLDSIDDEKFIEIARVQNGTLISQVSTPIYAEIEDELASRTYDESGNYTVKPFIMSLQDNNVNTDYFNVVLSPGKAYIYGYKYETISDTTLIVPKARTTQNVINQVVSMNYGNYVYVDNVNGVFNTTTMEPIDIHCVPASNVDVTSLATYNKTKIGTARVRDINFFGGDILVPGRKFEYYFSDTTFNTITGNMASTISTSAVQLASANSSTFNDAYIGATITIDGGPSAGDRRTIVDYVGANNVAIVSTPFTTSPTTGSHYFLSFDFTLTDSFVKHAPYTLGATGFANASISTISKSNGQANGLTGVTETSLLPLIFSYPDSYIANNITNQSFEYRKVYTGVQFTSGTSEQLSSGSDDFVGTTATSNIASTIMNNFLVICTDKQTSGRANGEQIKVTTSISGPSPQLATFSSGNASESFSATVYAKMFTPSASPRQVVLSLANTSTLVGGSLANTFVNPTGSTTKVYLDSGQVIISNPSQIVGTKESLFISNIIAVPKIWDLAGAGIPAAGTDLTIFRDVTGFYDIIDGQTDSMFDFGSIRLRGGFKPPKGPLVVCVRYYKMISDSGYLTVDSYPQLDTLISEEGNILGTGYSMIPSYTDSSGNLYQRRDSIDFRPNRVNATNNNPAILNGIQIPVAATNFESNYRFYLGRRDLLSLSSNKQITTTTGTPSKYPQNPIAPARSMILYTLNIPPYTLFASNVTADYVDNRNYTMRDIGLIDKRLQAVEYYVQLSQLEANASTRLIKDVNGLDRTKQGILADPFDDASFSDSTQSDYHAGISSSTGTLVPEANTISITLTANTQSGVAVHEDKVLLSYIIAPCIVQNTATKTTPVTDYLFASFEGQLYTVPEADIWKDVTQEPDTLINTNIVNTNYTNTNVIQRDVDSRNR